MIELIETDEEEKQCGKQGHNYAPLLGFCTICGALPLEKMNKEKEGHGNWEEDDCCCSVSELEKCRVEKEQLEKELAQEGLDYKNTCKMYIEIVNKLESELERIKKGIEWMVKAIKKADLDSIDGVHKTILLIQCEELLEDKP